MSKIARSAEDMRKGRLPPFGFIWREFELQALKLVPFRPVSVAHIYTNGDDGAGERGGGLVRKGFNLAPFRGAFQEIFYLMF